ncbi:cache domain-containing protein, partial [Fusobacterium sp.]|uniref:cache domain-containing protein n=1 Tax=Fusobacterium sp. TaxID=68766 RepID=UPI0026067505
MGGDKRVKQFTITIFVIASIINIVSFFSFQESIRQEEIKHFKSELKGYAKHKVQDTKLIIDGMVNRLEETKKLIEEKSNFEEDVIKRILIVATRMNYFNFTSFAYSDGKGFDNADQRFNILDRNYFKKSMEGKIGISGVISSRVENNKPVQIISIPTYDKNNKVAGVLFGVFDFQTIEKITNRKVVRAGKNKTYILTYEGEYITKPENDLKYINFWNYLSNTKISKKEIRKIKRNFLNKKEG